MWALGILAATLGQITVEVPAFEGQWKNLPARYELAQPFQTAVVYDETTKDAVPSKIQQQRDKRYLYWLRSDDGTQPHRYRIQFDQESNLPPPVFVGAGDMMEYGRNSVTADLGVGLWAHALPIDWDRDGDYDLIYGCTDVPQNGTYLYIQTRPNIFTLSHRIGDGVKECALGDINADGKVDLLAGDVWYDDLRANGLSKKVEGLVTRPEYKLRDFQTKQVDWDGDGLVDLVSAGGDWREYGWDNAYDEFGNWTAGPLRGFVKFHKNSGTNEAPKYDDEGEVLEADDHPIDPYGKPGPCIADFDNDGDLDLICGEFRDSFTYYENVGTRTNPRLAAGQPVYTGENRLRIDLCMMNPEPVDWNSDGRIDLIVGQEDGRVSIILNRGMSRGTPVFATEQFLREMDPPLKSGILSTPWIDPLTGDLYCGNSAGYFEKFAWERGAFRTGRYLENARRPVRIQAGYNGSIQGPAEAKWGYTAVCMGDITGDGVEEIVYNGIIGRIEYLQRLDQGASVDGPVPVKVSWPGEAPRPAWNWWKPGPADLIAQWRTRPQVLDIDRDGSNDLVAVDHEGYLAFYRNIQGNFMPGERIFKDESGAAFRMTEREAGGSGRQNSMLVDWDQDGDWDLIRNTESAGWWENIGDFKFVPKGDFPGRKLAGHTTAPFAWDWHGDGSLDLIMGAEDGRIYCLHRAYIEQPAAVEAVQANVE